MGSQPQVPIEDMYTAWVANNRNAARAAEAMGIKPRILQYHAQVHDFPGRYAREFNATAEGLRRMVYTDMLLKLPDVMKSLMGMISDEQSDNQTRLQAIRVYLSFLPKPEPAPDYDKIFEAKYRMPDPDDGDGGASSAEDLIRLQLEANIVDASDERSRTKAR